MMMMMSLPLHTMAFHHLNLSHAHNGSTQLPVDGVLRFPDRDLALCPHVSARLLNL